MSQFGSHGEGTSSGRERFGQARRRTRELRSQAEVAWSRVRRAVPRSGPPEVSLEGLLDAAQRVPSEGYLAGIGMSLATSAWLFANGKRDAGFYVGFWGPLAMVTGMYLKALGRRSR